MTQITFLIINTCLLIFLYEKVSVKLPLSALFRVFKRTTLFEDNLNYPNKMNIRLVSMNLNDIFR